MLKSASDQQLGIWLTIRDFAGLLIGYFVITCG